MYILEVLARDPKVLEVFPNRSKKRRPRTLVVFFLILCLCCVVVASGCQGSKSSSETGSSGDGSGDETGSSPTTSEPSADTGAGTPSGDDGAGAQDGGAPADERDTAMPREPVEPLEGAVLAVVENHPAARPQSGLDKADVVYEADVVAGITRFLAVYHSEGASKIGPIRSVRKFLVEIAHAYDSPVAHAGGNADALKLIKSLKGFKDMDEIYNSGAFFWRDKTRKQPHNLYTSTNLLQKGAEKKGYSLVPPPNLPTASEKTPDTTTSPSGFNKSGSGTSGSSATGSTAAGSGEASVIRIPFSERSDTKNIVEYRFEHGAYKRFINGKPHAMRDGAFICPKNVVVLFVETKEEWGDDPQLINKVIGCGKALFFSGGGVHNGSWKKPGPRSHFVFTLENGEPVRFLPGKTWIEIVDRNLKVTYR